MTLSSGWGCRFRMTSDGRRQILQFLLPGDAIGLSDLAFGGGEAGAKTITDCRFCVFDMAVARDAVMRHKAAYGRLLRAMATNLGVLEDQLVNLGRLTATERIARLIVDLRLRLELRGMLDGDAIPFPLNQIHIADAVGLTPLHVHRVLKDLRSRGLMELQDRRLAILDPPGLLSAAACQESDLARRRRQETEIDDQSPINPLVAF